MAVSEDVRKAVITVVLVINLKYEWGGGVLPLFYGNIWFMKRNKEVIQGLLKKMKSGKASL